MLHDIYHSAQRRDYRKQIFLFCTVVKSEQYLGVAQMTSDVDFSKSFGYWWEKTKWNGVMNLKWVYIKDVNYQEFSNIFYLDKPVTHHRDGTRLDFETGLKMLKIFSQANNNQNIFEDFPFMDEREEKMRVERDIMDSVSEPSKHSSGYHGHGYRENSRHHRDRHGHGYYRKQSKYSGGSEYHPKRKELPKKDFYEEREDRSEEKNPGIVIQKKSAKPKKSKKGGVLYQKKEQQPEASGDKSQIHTNEQDTSENKTIDLPPSHD